MDQNDESDVLEEEEIEEIVAKLPDKTAEACNAMQTIICYEEQEI
ncbi:23596_t:CDS:2 [Racocetra persica]|uniref:23596_t:CDS:1 n=1 Tax=Racocetra persica TaxID=160502 RepID=A0ACA9L7S8_9GLOM|nr:23596_t:CDS:2 [Racocetra persica]